MTARRAMHIASLPGGRCSATTDVRGWVRVTGYGLTVDEAQRQAAQTADKLDGKVVDHGQA